MKILVGYDGSNAALAAIEQAKRHARAFQAEKVYLVRSMEGGQDVARKEFDNAEHELGRVNRALTDEDVPSEPHFLVRGLSPGEDLVQFAKENGVDEMIIGVRRRSKVGKLVFGSTAQYVILNAPCPVVSVK
jgi:nucleotide-binding universal stress UspA family protein